MAADVVVEISVHVFALRGPFADTIGPPAQVFVGVGAAVERVPVGAVQA